MELLRALGCAACIAATFGVLLTFAAVARNSRSGPGGTP